MRNTILFLMILLSLSMMFASCNADKKESDINKTTTATTTVATTTDIDFKIAGDASNKVKGYSMAKLKLDGKKSDYKFLTSTNSKEIDGVKYIEVVAVIQKETGKDGSVSMDTKGTYYVTLDNNKCFVKNSKTQKLEELK